MKQFNRIIACFLIALTAVPSWAAMYQVQQSTTAYPLVFYMVDSTDHISAKTGLTCTVTVSKAGAAFASPSGAVTEIANGWYKVAGNATDSNTLGPLMLKATATGADEASPVYEVVAVNPQSATAFVTGVNSLAPPTNWNLMGIDASGRVDVGKHLGQAVTLDANNVLNVSTKYVGGTLNTAGDIIGEQRLRMPRKTWYVATTGNDSNAGTLEAPYLTVGAAKTACRSGDTIFVSNGTYSELIDLDTANKACITIRGESRTGTIIQQASATGYAPVITFEHGTTLSNLTVQITGNDGTAVSGLFDKHNITIDRCLIKGKWDGALVAYGTFNPRGLRIYGSYFEATYDAINISGCQNAVIEDSYFKTTGDYNSGGGGVASYSTSCVRATADHTQARFRNCTFEVAHGTPNAGQALKGSCVVVKGADSHLVFEDCTFKGRKTSATDSGNLLGIASDETTPGAYHAEVRNCRFDLTTSGSGTVYDVDASPSGATVNMDASTFAAAKLNGTSNIRTDLVPTTAASTLDVSSTGEAGLDFNNIKDASGAHTLTNIRVPNVTLADTITTYTGNTPQTGDNFPRLGAPAGASLAADIAATKSDTAAALTRLPAALVAGRMDASVGAMAANVLTAAATAHDAAVEIGAESSGGGGTTASVDNTKLVDAFVVDLSKRNDGTTVGTKTIYLRVGETPTVWINTAKVAGGEWLYDVTAATSSSPSQLAVSSFGKNRELAVLHLDTTSAVVGTTYTITTTIKPTSATTLIGKISVVIVAD